MTPLNFICNRRQKKFFLSPYIQHRIPKIEQYANQFEWVEKTLIDWERTEDVVDNVLVDLDRRFDEDSFVQVLGESQSQRKSQWHSGQTVEVGPSKQPGFSEQLEESKQPMILEELTQFEQIMSNPLIL